MRLESDLEPGSLRGDSARESAATSEGRVASGAAAHRMRGVLRVSAQCARLTTPSISLMGCSVRLSASGERRASAVGKPAAVCKHTDTQSRLHTQQPDRSCVTAAPVCAGAAALTTAMRRGAAAAARCAAGRLVRRTPATPAGRRISAACCIVRLTRTRRRAGGTRRQRPPNTDARASSRRGKNHASNRHNPGAPPAAFQVSVSKITARPHHGVPAGRRNLCVRGGCGDCCRASAGFVAG
jgi:hypothetical protein